jgi:hypothetical protein
LLRSRPRTLLEEGSLFSFTTLGRIREKALHEPRRQWDGKYGVVIVSICDTNNRLSIINNSISDDSHGYPFGRSTFGFSGLQLELGKPDRGLANHRNIVEVILEEKSV